MLVYGKGKRGREGGLYQRHSAREDQGRVEKPVSMLVQELKTLTKEVHPAGAAVTVVAVVFVRVHVLVLQTLARLVWTREG